MLTARRIRVAPRVRRRAFAAGVLALPQRSARLRLELLGELALRAPPVSAVWIASFYERLFELVAAILPVVGHEILGDCSTSPTGGRRRARYRDLAPILGWRANISDLTTRPSLEGDDESPRLRPFGRLPRVTGPLIAHRNTQNV